MATEIRVPALGESISEATVGKWFKKQGETVLADEPLVELETDKVTLEVNAPSAGVLSEIVANTGETVAIGALLGQFSAAAAGASAPEPKQAPSSRPAKAATPAPAMPPSPAAAKIAAEKNIGVESVVGSGKRGQVLKGAVRAAAGAAEAPVAPPNIGAHASVPATKPSPTPQH